MGNKFQQFNLEPLMRWYGPTDPIPLNHFVHAGCSGIVTALHDKEVGEIWSEESIRQVKEEISKHDLTWTVVESLPVHDDIKTHAGSFQQYIKNYRKSLVNLSKHGIQVVTYNFMPVLDWLRTDTTYKQPGNSETLAFEFEDFIVFDLHMLDRPEAGDIYSNDQKINAKKRFDEMSPDDRQRLYRSVMMGLPGSGKLDQPQRIMEALAKYKGITTEDLKENLIYFLKQVVPVAEKVGIKLAIHPDDPPFPVLGLPRIMSTEDDIRDIMTAVPSNANGLCFCTGSFGSRPDNDLVKMIQKWGSRIYFFHLRNTKRLGQRSFVESNHLKGNSDMFRIMKEIVQLMHQEKRNIPMRPDHGKRIMDDLHKEFYPGYSAIGRLKGLAELQGLEYGVRSFLRGQ